MSRANKTLLAILVVLLLILGVIAGVIVGKANPFSQRSIAEPFNETRYAGTLDDASSLTGDPDKVHVVVVVRFYDDGERGTMTSPTIPKHTDLIKVGDNIFEEVPSGTGIDDGAGTVWTFTPQPEDSTPSEGASTSDGEGENEVLLAIDVEYETPDGKTGSGSLTQTDPKDDAGEIGLNPDIKTPKFEYGDFGEDRQRAIGEPVFQKAGDKPLLVGTPGEKPAEATGDEGFATLDTVDTSVDPKILGQTKVVFRGDPGSGLATVTYPERRCYGELERTDKGFVEKILVGDCDSGGIWRFLKGNYTSGVVEYISKDETYSARTHITVTEWEDIDGEAGVSLTGPVVNYYEELGEQRQTRNKDDTGASGAAAPATIDAEAEEAARQDGKLTAAGIGPIALGMTFEEAVKNGLSRDSLRPAPDMAGQCQEADLRTGLQRLARVYLEDGKVVAISRENGEAYFNGKDIHSFEPGLNVAGLVPGETPTEVPAGEWTYHRWKLTDADGTTFRMSVLAVVSETKMFVTAPGSSCYPANFD